jgi:hypothetical protein
MVIVNRANTYEGERTPMPELLDLIEKVLEARTGISVEDPELGTLEESPDPMITHVSNDHLAEFVGEWAYPPARPGLPGFTTLELTLGAGHLVGFSPVSGTFKLYLQDDGSFYEEDSHQRYLQVRNDDGSFAGIVEERRNQEPERTCVSASAGATIKVFRRPDKTVLQE